MAMSNDTRVRRLGFWKIIPRTLPRRDGRFPPCECSRFNRIAKLEEVFNLFGRIIRQTQKMVWHFPPGSRGRREESIAQGIANGWN